MKKQVLSNFFIFTFILLMGMGSVDCGAEADRADKTNEQDYTKEYTPPLPAGNEWKLVWSDEFNATELDESKWETPVGKRRDGYWLKEDSYLDGSGNLIIRTKKDGDRYTSGAIRTLGKFEHRFGYWVARCKFHTQEGHWPAFWIFSRPGVFTVGNEGRDGTEIDIMEKAWSKEDKINHALHWDGYGKDHKSVAKQVIIPGLSSGFHTFGLHWKTDEYIFYVDGKETWRTNEGGISQVPAYIKLTEEIGKWAGDIKKAALPDFFVVDYVRVYEMVNKNR